jgi:hypothetical protein
MRPILTGETVNSSYIDYLKARAKRVLAVTGIAFGGLVLLSAPAHADKCEPYPDGVCGTTTTTDVDNTTTTLPEGETTTTTTGTETSEYRPEHGPEVSITPDETFEHATPSLALTGGDYLGLAAIGAGAVGAGTVLVMRSRKAV